MNTEAYINLQKADLSEDGSMPFTFKLADIRNPESRSASYSKTVVFPGTKANNIIFKHIFEINVDNVFNPNLKSDVSILQDGIEIFSGYLQLIQINKVKYDLIEYECLLVSNLNNLFSDMADKYVQGNSDINDDIDFADLNHQLTATNVNASFSAPVGQGYVYGLIDHGLNSSLVVPTAASVPVTDIFPAVYVKEYFDRVFEKHGYTYQSTFLDSDLFKRLVIPYSSGKRPQISDIFRDFQTTRASLSTTQIISGPIVGNRLENLHFDDVTTPPNSDPGANLNTSTYLWNPPNQKSFRMQCGIDFVVTSSTSGTGTMSITLELVDDTVPDVIGSYLFSTTYAPLNNRGSDWATDTLSLTISFAGTVLTTHNYRFRLKVIQGSLTNFQTIEVSASTFMEMAPATMDMAAYDIMPINGCIPKKLKQADIIKGIIKMFNLYVEVDKDDPTVYHMEPRNDYYDAGDTVDWSLKHDNNKKVEVLPMSELNWKNLIFTYADDNDYLNTKYKQKVRQLYGEQEVISVNDFVKDRKDVTLPFAPTPIYNVYDSTLTPAQVGIIVPGIFTLNPDNTRSMYEGKPRILYYAGIRDVALSLIENGAIVISDDTSPFFGNVDDPTNSTVDILFGTLGSVFYSWTSPISLTDNTLYNKYYSRMIEEVVNINAKLVKAYFNLTPADIQNFNFANKVFWRDAYYYVNQIIDYDPLNEDTTLVELLFIQEEVATFEPTSTTIYGQIDSDIQ